MEDTPSKKQRTIGLLALAFLLGVVYVVWLAAGAPNGSAATSPEEPATVKPTRTPRPTKTPRPSATPEIIPTLTPTPVPKKVGIVAGHWKSDSGAVCPDGLEEVTINLDVASRVVAILQYEGYTAELLPEFSEKLNGYQADAFVSIHADSCSIPEASGFKVARVASSAIPEEEDRLVACLTREYAKATGLSFHKNSITFDMTIYHAFNEIDPETPGAIIELGFMAADRELLIDRAYEVAQGVARGIACFLEGE
ncbi:MAG: N-acetylmuramoyl-L-alanine amidase family protein [Anaerolineae bacterium]